MSAERASPPEARAAVVTGASSGIGEATARRLADEGWRVLVVARRQDRLTRLAAERPGVATLAVDLTAEDAPAQVAERVEHEFGRLDLLVNNAGASWPAAFGEPDGGWPNVRRTMEVDFDAVVRLTERLLPVLRRSRPAAVVNVASVAGRIGRPRMGAYSAAKAALAAWSDALHLEERAHGVHVGLVMPGFVATEGFPQRQLTGRAATRWIVSTPERVAAAILDAGPGGRAERYVPRPYVAVGAARALAPALARMGSRRAGR